MTDQQIETSFDEIKALFKETARQQQETARRQQETDRQLKENARGQQKTDKQLQETDRSLKESNKKTQKSIKELGKQIGGLGRKFGYFTEGMAFPSMERVLRQKFKMEYVSERVRVRKNGGEIELDVFAYANGDVNQVMIVEVKSRFRDPEILDELLRNLERFPKFFPEHKDKALYAVVAAVDIGEEIRKKILRHGIYLATIRDDTFRLDLPKDFQPKRFN